MIQHKRLLSFGLIVAMVFSLMACGKESVEYDPLTEANDTVYEISICQDDDNDYYNNITLGFHDALRDLFGENHVNITSRIADEEASADAICADYVNKNVHLIFANGPDSVSSAALATKEIPVVGSGVVDYQHLLHLTAGIGNKWNYKTGTNVTGISSEPDIAAQLSLMIETTPDLKSVGLLYTAGDNDALYQLATMEMYLDQAGIPWKEYSIPTTVNTDAIRELDSEASATGAADDTKRSGISVIRKTKTVAPSITEGSNHNVEVFGGTNLIDGILSPNSAHAPATSRFWTDELSVGNTVPLSENATLEDTIAYASNECSCIFIPAGSYLRDQVQTIVNIATEAGVRTVGGDDVIGESTLTSTYLDPYALGYAAGKTVYRILVNGDNPGAIKISTPDIDSVKLYNGALAEQFEMEFPKSFHEVKEFKETYVIGSSVKRITENK